MSSAASISAMAYPTNRGARTLSRPCGFGRVTRRLSLVQTPPPSFVACRHSKPKFSRSSVNSSRVRFLRRFLNPSRALSSFCFSVSFGFGFFGKERYPQPEGVSPHMVTPRASVCQSLFHLAAAALRAISERCWGDSWAARAFPPLSPPRLPSSAAATRIASFGSSSGVGSAVPVSSPTIW